MGDHATAHIALGWTILRPPKLHSTAGLANSKTLDNIRHTLNMDTCVHPKLQTLHPWPQGAVRTPEDERVCRIRDDDRAQNPCNILPWYLITNGFIQWSPLPSLRAGFIRPPPPHAPYSSRESPFTGQG